MTSCIPGSPLPRPLTSPGGTHAQTHTDRQKPRAVRSHVLILQRRQRCLPVPLTGPPLSLPRSLDRSTRLLGETDKVLISVQILKIGIPVTTETQWWTEPTMLPPRNQSQPYRRKRLNLQRASESEPALAA